jgi:hypothetical protein
LSEWARKAALKSDVCCPPFRSRGAPHANPLQIAYSLCDRQGGSGRKPVRRVRARSGRRSSAMQASSGKPSPSRPRTGRCVTGAVHRRRPRPAPRRSPLIRFIR